MDVAVINWLTVVKNQRVTMKEKFWNVVGSNEVENPNLRMFSTDISCTLRPRESTIEPSKDYIHNYTLIYCI